MDCALGIDLGTTKVAVAVVDRDGAQVHAASREHHAGTPTADGRAEQDAERILATATTLVRSLPPVLRHRIGAIGLTGQMHGVVLHDGAGLSCSPLVTWQDRRTAGDPDLLPRLTQRLGRPIHAGYGLATLAWWAAHGGLRPDAHAATIHGLLAARWAGMARAPIDPGDAHAWGGSEPVENVPAAILPVLVPTGSPIGSLIPSVAADLGLAAGIPLAAPLGDNQASLRATIADADRDCAFTIGTGCQCSVLVPRSWSGDPPAACERRPFDVDHDALVSAPLAGGAAWKWLAETVRSWIADCGVAAPPLDAVFARLDTLGLAATDRLTIHPHLAGERHDTSLTGSILGLTLTSGSLGEVARAMARGIARNALRGLPASVMASRTRLVASGNALRRSALLRAMAEAEAGLPLVLIDRTEEAATGAALVAARLIP